REGVGQRDHQRFGDLLAVRSVDPDVDIGGVAADLRVFFEVLGGGGHAVGAPSRRVAITIVGRGWRRKSIVAGVAIDSVNGLGVYGYGCKGRVIAGQAGDRRRAVEGPRPPAGAVEPLE